MTTDTWFAIRDTKDGKYIGLERDSGGYPWKPPHPSQVTLWAEKQKAIEYCETMGWRRSSDTYGALSWEILEVRPIVQGSVHLTFAEYRMILESPLGT